MDPFGDGNNIARFRLLGVCSESIYRQKILSLVLDHVLSENKYEWSPQDPDGRGRTNYLFPIFVGTVSEYHWCRIYWNEV